MNETRVSIIIPCRNAAAYLSDCLESAISQTWPFCEVIVVNDRSTDESLDIARGFRSRGVQLFQNRGSGAAAARNTGLDASRGDFIQFLDADDLLDLRKVETQLNVLTRLRSSRTALAMGVWGKFRQVTSQAVFENEAVYEARTGIEFIQLHYETGSMVQPGAWLTPRNLLERAGRWNEELTLNDDGEFFARVALASDEIVFTPDAKSYYRVGHAGQLSRRRTLKDLESLYRSVELATSYLLSRDLSERSRAATGQAWMKLAWELYPTSPAHSKEAEDRGRRTGGTIWSLPIGKKSKIVCLLLGWRIAKLFELYRNG